MKIVIYTSLFGAKEALGDPVSHLNSSYTDLDITFICVTDSALNFHPTWEYLNIEDDFLDSSRQSRRAKCMPHRFFSEFDFSIYIDNLVKFKRLPNSRDLETNSDYVFRLFEHKVHRGILEEAYRISELGYEHNNKLLEQIFAYKQYDAYDAIPGHSTCTLIIREHMHPKLIKFGELWWEHILRFSKRDQMSFDFLSTAIDTRPEYISGSKSENSLIYKPDDFAPEERILANFDAKKYARKYGVNSTNEGVIRSHYLNNNVSDSASDACKVINNANEFLAELFESGIGSFNSPRRNIAKFIDHEIKQMCGRSINIIVLYDDSPSFTPYLMSYGEIHRLTESLKYFTGVKINSIASLSIRNQRLVDEENQVGENNLDFVILVNQSPNNSTPFFNALKNFSFSSEGVGITVGSKSQSISELFSFVANSFPDDFQTCILKISSQEHDDIDDLLFNSIASFNWIRR